MSRVIRDLEKRLGQMEETIKEMKALLNQKVSEPWWIRTAGAFKDDKVFAEIVREMRKARQEDYAAVCREIDEYETKQKAKRGAGDKSGRKAKRSTPKRNR